MQLKFPLHGDPAFREKLMQLDEYRLFGFSEGSVIPDKDSFEARVQDACGGFEKMMYQHLMQHYISRRSPYRSLLIFHGLGVGKTCSSITIAESFLTDHTHGDEPKILVVSPTALKKSYEDQIFSTTLYLNKEFIKNQCTGDTYAKLVHGNPENDVLLRRVQQLIRSRYMFLTYDSLVSYITTHPRVRNKVIIIDEAHNLRQQETEKKTAEALETLVKNGDNNRLVLLSATPMYNEPDEILWLMSLLLMNDKRKDVKIPKSLFDTSSSLSRQNHTLLSQLASEYISYIRGKNPFTFAVRLRPDASEIPVINADWSQPLTDGIVPSQIGIRQKIESATTQKNGIASPKQAQWMNITYPGNGHGETGFWKVFSKPSSDEKIFPVSYKNAHKNALMPGPNHLGAIASKMDSICRIVKNSEGIVLIYSQFVWSGVVPLAVAFEHMGFQRVGGPNLVHNLDRVSQPVSYPGIMFPGYCILSGDTKVMGESKIEHLQKMINHTDNIRGEKIKVVFITPIAGEGLSFRNIREVHILDPWYHMNRVEQVIGRAIRTCSHVALPLEERNVTVFLHACVSNENDTADVNAFKISARKLHQTSIIERILRDGAVDCPLLYHLNYQPKSSFGFQVAMRTSQQHIIQHSFGDGEEHKPNCKNVATLNTKKHMRTEIFANVLPTIQRRIERYVLRKINETLYFSHEELLRACNISENVASVAIHNLVRDPGWIPGYKMYVHRNGYVFVPNQSSKPQYEVLLQNSQEDTVDTANTEHRQLSRSVCNVRDIVSSIPLQDEVEATLLLYQAFDSKCWDHVAREILASQSQYERVLELMSKHGAFVTKKELPRHVSGLQGNYIGYVNIFATQEPMQVWLMPASSNAYIAASDMEVEAIQNKRKKWERPNSTYGVMEPTKFSKDANAPLRTTFKVMTVGPAGGKRRGVVCNPSIKKNEFEVIFKELKMPGAEKIKGTKDQMCSILMKEFFKKGLLLMYPEWKPT